MIRYVLTFLVLFSFITESKASYDVNDNCKKAWMLLMDFRFDEAKQLVAEEIKINPENYYAYYLDQTCDAVEMMINGSDEDYEQFSDHFYAKREIMDDHDGDSPYYLACYSEMQIQLGMFNVTHGDQFSGVRKMYSAYRKVYRNLDKHPDFAPSVMLDGFFNVALANLPPFVKWAISFFGVKSDIDHGFDILHKNYQKQKEVKGMNAESALFIILSAKINKTPERVYNFIKTLDSTLARLYVFQYFGANIAYRTGRNEEALEILEQMPENRNEYTKLTYSYLVGKALMRKLDKKADVYLKYYLKNHKNQEYFKEINYKLALYYLINGNKDMYRKYAEVVKNEGMDLQERDREALYDVSVDYPPNVTLIKTKLLLDGGYVEESEKELAGFDPDTSEYIGRKLDYLLLSARIVETKKNTDKAIKLYKQIIKDGEDEDYYFASEAALRLGNIFKEQRLYKLSNMYFEKSLKLYDSDYYEYIEDKARKSIMPK